MARENFIGKLPLNKANKERLTTINEIIEEYKADGYILTLRQLYYQLVSRDVIANNDKEYGKLSTLLVKGRMAGIVDWSAIEDRVRRPELPYYADNISDALSDIHRAFRLDRQKGQQVYIEVWVEKDALSAVMERVTNKYHVNLMVNRGYSSASAMYAAYNRFIDAYEGGANKVVILYFGDHDPSGLDMIRDVRERIEEMMDNGVHADGLVDDAKNAAERDGLGSHFEVKQIALNMQQIRQFAPPENPAKITDPRAGWYIEKYGNKSWELDALPPKELNRLCSKAIEDLIDIELFNEQAEKERKQKSIIHQFMLDHENED